ncbi:MAG: efflux RND transporter periplasmic adaptor subunit [Neisseriaceae bacterium]|nr:efflux RND transporter periplasmic adaptor subunit [Neisseriaceae bacterium]
MKKLKKLIFPLLIITAIVGFLAYQKISADKDRLPENIISGNVRLEMGRTDIASLYAGKIEQIFVNEGDEVVAGQDLVKLEDTQSATQLAAVKSAKARAEAALAAQKQKQANADLDLQNAQQLYKENLVSKSELKKRQIQKQAEKSGIDAANAAVAEVNAQILRIENINNDMTLKAPIDGVVEYRLFETGEVIGAGMKVVSLLNPADVSAQIFVPVGKLPQIAVGDEARIVIDGLNAVFPAKISFIANQAQFTPKYVETKSEREKLMFRVKLVIDKDIALKYKHYLKGGLTATAYISTNKQFPENLTVKLPKE